MLAPGWSSAPSPEDANTKRGKFSKPSSAPKEKYATLVDGHVMLHSYDLINKKGTYSKGSRADACVCLSPGSSPPCSPLARADAELQLLLITAASTD